MSGGVASFKNLTGFKNLSGLGTLTIFFGTVALADYYPVPSAVKRK